jgi:P2-related tail formation protein
LLGSTAILSAEMTYPRKGTSFSQKSTLAEFGIELMVMKLLQNNPKMLPMLFFTLGVD